METVVKVVIVPEEEWRLLVYGQQEMLRLLQELQISEKPVAVKHGESSYITAIEFMAAVRIKRTKFDQLVAQNKVKTIRKGRKIYVPVGEVERYFKC